MNRPTHPLRLTAADVLDTPGFLFTATVPELSDYGRADVIFLALRRRAFEHHATSYCHWLFFTQCFIRQLLQAYGEYSFYADKKTTTNRIIFLQELFGAGQSKN